MTKGGEKKLNKKIIISALVLTLVGFGVSTAGKAYAAADSSRVDSLVSRLAQKFGLEASDVQSVFDEHRSLRQKQMKAAYEDRLNRYVKDGKISQAQKLLITAKHAEMQSLRAKEMESMKSMTDDQRRAAFEKSQSEREAHRLEMEAWAKANGIDSSILGIGGRGMEGFGRKGGTHGF